MITLSTLFQNMKEAKDDVQLRFIHPSLYVVWIDDAFAGLSDEQRLASVAHSSAIEPNELEDTLASAGVILLALTKAEFQQEYEFLNEAPTSHHWIEFLADRCLSPSPPTTQPLIHFYGFKGGQGRSTVLGMVAKHLAKDGYTVLVIDADIEAPSLQSVLSASSSKLESTLFGCARFKLTPTPEAVYVPKGSDGRVDLLACRPSEKEWDLDFANFALRTSLDPNVLNGVLSNLLGSSNSNYDVILVDHRTGLSASVIPIVASHPGPVVICLRLDEQSDRAESYFDVLFRMNPSNPGIFVSFSLNPEETYEDMLSRHREKMESLLEGLGNGMASNSNPKELDAENSTEPDDLLAHWVKWYHDPNFLSGPLPEVGDILTKNRKSLATIRDLLGLAPRKVLESTKSSKPAQLATDVDLTGSGNTDRGPLIQADALRHLRVPSTPYTYILGRKGTGKTRLLRALAEDLKGRPMLVADDYPYPHGILSSDTLLADLASLLRDDPTKLWWALLDAVILSEARNEQQLRLRESLDLVRRGGPNALSITSIRDRVVGLNETRVLLIDGVETAFQADQTSVFVEGLFRFLSATQSDTGISQRLTIRLFIRTDLVEGARENIEQQIENRVLRLAWDTQTILNFVLARIASINWFKENFSEAIAEINSRATELLSGTVSEDDCSQLLLKIFPLKVRRHNVGTLTFLKTYFSDGEGQRASFYPRIYDSFLRFIADGGPHGTVTNRNQMEGHRIAQDLIFEAHVQACRDYLEQVKDELKNLLDLGTNLAENKQRISQLLDSFNGMTTPFELEVCLKEILAKLNNAISEPTLRKAMQQMKRIGIFEDRPDYPGHWRVGRLFKSSLGMRYNRKRRGDDS
ncbi:MAG TPA: AAA family ATPase [Prosthecobacter sp.]|nr:AAA family ATPase [Prosthecobacter sp.]